MMKKINNGFIITIYNKLPLTFGFFDKATFTGLGVSTRKYNMWIIKHEYTVDFHRFSIIMINGCGFKTYLDSY